MAHRLAATGCLIALVVGCGPRPLLILREMYEQRDLARSANTKDKECTQTAAATAGPAEPCAPTKRCIEAIAEATSRCQEVLDAMAQGDAAAPEAAFCQVQGASARRICNIAGVR